MISAGRETCFATDLFESTVMEFGDGENQLA